MIHGRGRDSVPRTASGDPLIVPPDGGEPVPYGSPSGLGDVLSDHENLFDWKIRNILQGIQIKNQMSTAGLMTPMPDLLQAVDSAKGDRGLLKEIAEEAQRRAGGHAARDYGDEFHTYTELRDVGEMGGPTPRNFEADVAAYAELTKGFRWQAIEPFVVVDELQLAGSPDRIFADVIGDTKTGSNIYNQQVKIAVQLAVYANAQYYFRKDDGTAERVPYEDLHGAPVNKDIAYVFWIHGGQGRLVEVDIARGWQLAKLAVEVLGTREESGLFTTAETAGASRRSNIAAWLAAQIRLRVHSREEMDALWRREKKHWTSEHSELAQRRLRRLEQGTVQ